jgi:ABC-type sugar transport system substrate-binding protein
MDIPAACRRAIIAFAAVAALLASGVSPVAAQGGLISLVAPGAQDVYLTAGNTGTAEEAAVTTPSVSRDVLIEPEAVTILDPLHGTVIEAEP